MTTIVVAVFKIDERLDREDEEELELVELLLRELGCDDVWVLVLARQLLSSERERISHRLGVVAENVCLAPRLYGGREGAVLLGNAIAYIGGHSRLTVFDCNAGQILESIDLPSHPRGAKIYGGLVSLEYAFVNMKVSASVRILEAMIEEVAGETSCMNQVIRQHVASVLRFLSVFENLLSDLPRKPTKELRLGDFESLLAIDLGREVDRLRAMRRDFPEEIGRMEFVDSVSAFFGYGRRALGALRDRNPHLGREVLPRFLGWLSVYFLAASKEAVACGRLNTGMLYLNRSFEVYVLAYLKRSGIIEKGRGGFVLRGGKPATSANMGRRFSEEFTGSAPREVLERVDSGLAFVRALRNANLLIHGFHSPDVAKVDKARIRVKGAILEWERCLEESARLIGGPVERFLKGERWNENLAKVIALCVVDHVRARDE